MAALRDESESLLVSDGPLKELKPAVYMLELSPDTSVYQDAVFMPLVQCLDDGIWKPSFAVYSKVAWLLFLNMLLQAFMAYKMLQVTENSEQDFRNDVLGLCESAKATDMIWMNYTSYPAINPDASYFDCGLLTGSVMSHVSYLDFDENGYWSLEEATKLQESLNGYMGRVGAFKNTFYGINYFRDPDANVSRDIPMSWLEAKRSEIQLCMILNPDLCGNMEARGILKQIFPIRGKQMRIRACAKNFEESGLCRALFASRFDWYYHHSKDICGQPSFNWNNEGFYNVAHFEAVQKWSDSDSVSSRRFISFMLLIMVMWFMLMMAEFHEVVRWLIVLMSVNTCNSAERLELKETGSGTLEILKLPTQHRNFVLLLVWLPRFLIFCLITVVGTVFLGAATDYVDLLLNATALGFLLEVDQMLHFACSDDLTRQQVASCSPISITTSNSIYHLYQKCYTFSYSLTLVLASCGFVAYINLMADGNQMIAQAVHCLCSVKGEQCLLNAVLTGRKQ